MVIRLLTVFLFSSSLQFCFANYVLHSVKAEPEIKRLTLKSNSFNADRKSFFQLGERYERLKRGLTVVHFKSINEYEFRTFDTYENEEETKQLVGILAKMLNNKATFVILAHDSGSSGNIFEADQFAALGLLELSKLQNRQAYLMHTIHGKISESVDNLTIEKEFDLKIKTSDQTVYFPKIKYEFEPNVNRYIAHAGGEVDGIKSTNTKEALDQNYAKGFRMFELDIIETSDGHLVAAHDWNMWSRFTDYNGTLPPTHTQFMAEKIYGDYTLLDFEGINKWFSEHPDATLVTDKINDPIAFADSFVDKDRLIMELFSVMAVEEAAQHGIHAMISQKPFFSLNGDKLDFLEINNVNFVAVSRRVIEKHTKLLLKLNKRGIKVYVYNVNFDSGKDEEYVQENEIGIVYGMYADKWVFDNVVPSASK